MRNALESTQAHFAAALLDPDSTQALLPELDSNDARTLDRVTLYRGNMHTIWEKTLANTFPVVRLLVGDESLGGLARAYGRACPSRNGDLNWFGAGFAGFLSTFPHVQSLPYLADVARLEWGVHRAYHAADAQMLERESLIGLRPKDLLAQRFSLNPACAWVESRYPIATIWLAHQPAAQVLLPQTLDQAEQVLITRPKWQVQVQISSAAELAALKALHAGRRMAVVIEAALRLDANFAFTTALLRWLEGGILVAR